MKVKNAVIFMFLSLGITSLAKDFQTYKPAKEIEKNEIQSSQIIKKNAKELSNKISNAEKDEVIMIEDGEYENLGEIFVKNNGVKISAKNPGKVIFSGLVQIILEGNNTALEGIVFTNGGPLTGNGAVIVKGNDIVIANNTFYKFNQHEYKPNEKGEYNATRWMTVSGKDNKILNNRFEGKYRRGTLLVVNNSPEKDNHIIANNIFKDHKSNIEGEFDNEKMKRINENSWEVMRVGDSKTSLLPSGTALAYNLFIGMDGESELVSMKSCDTIIKGNTVIESSSIISLRHGNGSLVEDNVVLGNNKPRTGGIYFFGEDHVIRNNYIENVMGTGDSRAGIVFNTGVNDVLNNEKLDSSVKGKELNKQWTPKNILLENNTVINSAQNILYSNKVHRVSLFDNSSVSLVYPAVNMTLKNNLSFAEGENRRALKGAEDKNPINTKYENNVFYGPIEGATFQSGVSKNKVELRKIKGIMETDIDRLGAKNLTVLTENMVGPNYNFK